MFGYIFRFSYVWIWGEVYPAEVRLKNEKQIPSVPFIPLPNFPDLEKTLSTPRPSPRSIHADTTEILSGKYFNPWYVLRWDAECCRLWHYDSKVPSPLRFIKEFFLPPWKETAGNNYQTEPSQSYWLLPGIQGDRKHITQYRNIQVTNIIQFLAIEVRILTQSALNPSLDMITSDFPLTSILSLTAMLTDPFPRSFFPQILESIIVYLARPATFYTVLLMSVTNLIMLFWLHTLRNVEWHGRIIMRDENRGNRRAVVAIWRCSSNQSIALSRFAPTADNTEVLEYCCCTSARWDKNSVPTARLS